MKSFIFVLLTSFFSIHAFAADSTKKVNSENKNMEETTRNDNRKPVSTGAYITGGVIGSTVGYGIGHAIQGRYGERGWIFTAGEAASVVAMISGLNSCGLNSGSIYSFNFAGCTNSGFTLGTLAFLGFHIWEVVDVWVGAKPVSHEDPPVQTYVVPSDKETKVGMVYRF